MRLWSFSHIRLITLLQAAQHCVCFHRNISLKFGVSRQLYCHSLRMQAA